MEPTFPKSAHAIVLPIISSLAIIILIVPFVWHCQLRNIGACSLVFYLSLSNLFTFINAILWPTEDYDNWWNGAGLCDIEAKLKWPCVTGLTCATLCITRNLANVLDIDRAEVSQTRYKRQRKIALDLAICFTIPLLQVILHYIIQYNRYYIMAIGGCAPSYDRSWPTIVIMYIWPLIFCLVNCYYAVLHMLKFNQTVAVIYRIRKYRSSFSHILSSSSSNLTTSRFLRLFLMAFTLILLYTPVTIYFFYVNLNIEWLSYDWNIIHDPEHWGTVVYLPPQGVRTFDCYCSIAMAFFVFIYFGMGGDAIDIYRKWMLKAGLGRLLPCLKSERVGNRKGSWSSRLSIVSRARLYFESNRKESNATTLKGSCDYTITTQKPACITAEPSSLKSKPPQPNTFRQHPSSCVPDFISPVDSDIIPPSEPLNPSSPLQDLPDQSLSAQFLSPISFFQRHLHLPNKIKSSLDDCHQNNSNIIDPECQFHGSVQGAHLRTHIWGEPSNKNRTVNELRCNRDGTEAFGVRKETNIFIKEEMRN